MNKKIVLVVILIVIALMLFGCGNYEKIPTNQKNMKNMNCEEVWDNYDKLSSSIFRFGSEADARIYLKEYIDRCTEKPLN